MPSKLLGLDVGSYSIKAALFTSTFKLFELTDLYESPPLQMDEVDAEEKPVIIKEAILRLLQENGIEPSTVVTALGGYNVSTRIITLPLPERQVEKVLPFELESHLPFELEEIIVDHHVIESGKNETTVLAAAVKKSVLAEHLAILKGANLDPAFVSLDSLSLYNLAQMSLESEFGTYAIVDVGHHKTSICIISNKQVKFVRTLFSGGKSVTESICDDLKLTWEQANEVKHTHGILELENHPMQSKDLRRLSAAVRKAIDPILREILQTLQAYKAQYSQAPGGTQLVETIYLSGGTSLIRNLPEYMQSLTKLTIKRLDLFPNNAETGSRLGAKQPTLAQAVGLGLRVAARGATAKQVGQINFRKGEFAFARDLSGIREKAVFFGRWVALVFFLALVHLGFRYQNLSRQNSQLEKQILRIYSEIVPDEPQKPKNASQAVKNLEARSSKLQQQQETLTAGLNELTALGVLREISERIAADVSLDTQELNIERNKIVIRGTTDSIASVDRIILALKEFHHFQKIDKGETRESADGKKTFLLTVTVGEESPKKENAKK